jgi:hypothetical protein
VAQRAIVMLRERVQAVLGKRLAKFGLELNPTKTRLVDFRPPAERAGAETTLPTTFTFLGFLHIWSKKRSGKATVWQRTAKDRLARTLKAINQQGRFMRPWPIAEQHHRLCRMLAGHFAYFGITGNYPRLATVVHWTRRIWRKWLSRRSWRSYVTWEKFLRLVARYPLPATDPVDLRTTHPPHAASGRRCVSDCEWRNGSGRPLRLSSTSWHSTRVGAAQNLAELDIDFAAIKQAAGWRSPRMPLQFAEKINVARSGMARAAAAAGRDEPVF